MDYWDCLPRLDHEWESFVADGTTPYRFCRACKKTLFNGRVYWVKA